MKQILILLLSLFMVTKGFSQSKDTILFYVVKVASDTPNYHQYDLSIYNFSRNPIAILHSCYINLISIAHEKLGRFGQSKDTSVYSFLYSARDEMNNYETSYNPNHNGALILPYQQLDLHVLIPIDSSAHHELEVEAVVMPDLNYNSFQKEIFRDPPSWYKEYKRLKYTVKL